MIVKYNDDIYDLYSTIGQLASSSIYFPDQTSISDIKKNRVSNNITRYEYKSFTHQLVHYFNLYQVCNNYFNLDRRSIILLGRRFNMGVSSSCLWANDLYYGDYGRKKEILGVFTMHRKDIKLLYELMLFYKYTIEDKIRNLFEIGHEKEQDIIVEYVNKQTAPFCYFNSFLEYIEYRIPKITIFVDKNFHSSKTKYKGLRKVIKQNFYVNPKFNYVVVDNIHNILYSTVKSEYKYNTNNIFEMEKQEREDINQFKEYLINLCNRYEFGTTDKSKQTREIFQSKNDELFPYKRILQGSSSSSLLLGKHA